LTLKHKLGSSTWIDLRNKLWIPVYIHASTCVAAVARTALRISSHDEWTRWRHSPLADQAIFWRARITDWSGIEPTTCDNINYLWYSGRWLHKNWIIKNIPIKYTTTIVYLLSNTVIVVESPDADYWKEKNCIINLVSSLLASMWVCCICDSNCEWQIKYNREDIRKSLIATWLWINRQIIISTNSSYLFTLMFTNFYIRQLICMTLHCISLLKFQIINQLTNKQKTVSFTW